MQVQRDGGGLSRLVESAARRDADATLAGAVAGGDVRVANCRTLCGNHHRPGRPPLLVLLRSALIAVYRWEVAGG
jgi:hypothetical protein